MDKLTGVWCFDWNKHRQQWQIKSVDRLDVVVYYCDEVSLFVPSCLKNVDGGRHGYLVATGNLEVVESQAFIR